MGGERLLVLREGQGPAPQERQREAERTACAQGRSGRLASTNWGGRKEMRSWGPREPPRAHPPPAGCCARISDFGGHLVPGSPSPETRVLEATVGSSFPIMGHIYPPSSALELASLYSALPLPGHRALISCIALNFKIAIEITVHFFPS